MSKVVVFKIDNGNFEEGFSGTVQFREEGGSVYREENISLPPLSEIPELYHKFKENYRNLEKVRRVINLETRGFDVDPNQNTNVSTLETCREAVQEFENCVEGWFNHPFTEQLRGYIENEVSKDESARVIIQTNNEILKRIPWHLWRLFRNRRKAWISLGAKYNSPSKPFNSPVKILAILGDDEGINLHQDARMLKNLIGAKVEVLKQPTRQQLSNKLRAESWDILCFAGHSKTSESGNDGIIQISNIDSPSLRDLRNAFTDAIDNGLNLAIFNSCDGLGLAHKLTELGIPRTIVMREPVPNKVAQEFLHEFLHLFSQGEKFHLAVRKAQIKLEGMEAEYPCASWLPIIYQNPGENSLYWRQSFIVKIKRGVRRLWQSHKVATLISLVLVGTLTAIIINQIFTLPPRPPVPRDSKTSVPQVQSQSLDKLFSQGEQILVKNKSNPNKQKGTAAFKDKKWDLAINEFRNSLNQTPNDPESLVYLNNAIAMKNSNPLKIAVAVPVEQPPGEDEEMLRGIAHAQSKLNCSSVDNIVKLIKTNQTNLCQGGIQGRQLLVEIVNDKGDSDTAIKVAQKIVTDKNKADILAVIGHSTSEMTLNAVEKEYQDKLLVVSATSNSVRFDTNSDIVLRTVINNTYEINEFEKKYVKSKFNSSGIRGIVVYEKGDTFSDSLKREFETKIPLLSNSTFDEYKFDDDNYSLQKLLALIQEKKANVLLLAPSGKEEMVRKALQVVKEISKNQNNKNLILLGASTMYSPITTSFKDITDYGKASEIAKLVVFTPWHRSNPNFESDFEKEAKNIWGDVKINWITAMAYDATKVIIEGLDKVGEQVNQRQLREKLLRNINNFSVQGATTTVKFEKKGGRKRTDGLGVLVQVKCNNTSCNFENLDS